jgi:hypothetical protein
MSTADDWTQLPEPEKEKLRLRLALAAAKMGLPSPAATTTPGNLALRHEGRIVVQRPHLKLIDQKLRWVHETPNAKLMIFTPPQVGKSNRVSRWLPFWWLSLHPRDRILLGSYADSLARGHSRAARDLVRDYGARYGLVPDPDEWAATDWSLQSGGGMRSRGLRGGFTGQSVDLALIDDPVAGRAEAESKVIRDATEDWYSGSFVSRFGPETRQIITMTRWHKDDLAGRLLKKEGRVEDGGEWTVLHLPAIAVAPDPDRGFYEDPLGREPGEALSHPKIPDGDLDALLAHWIRQRGLSSVRDWGALYQGVPVTAEGALLTEGELNAREESVSGKLFARTAVGVDPSGGGRDTAGVVGGGVLPDGRFFWTDNRTAVMPAAKWSREACLLAYELEAGEIIIETNYGGDQATTLIRQAWDALQKEDDPETGEPFIPLTAICPAIVGVHSKKGKYLRAEPIAQAVVHGRAWFAPGLGELKKEWLLWEPGSTWSPGGLDAAVHLAWGLLPPVPAGALVQSVASRRLDGAGAGSGLAARRVR